LFSTYVVHSAPALAASGESHDSDGEDSVEFEPPAATVLSSVVSVDSLASRLSRCLTNVTIDHLISTYVPPRAPVHLPAPLVRTADSVIDSLEPAVCRSLRVGGARIGLFDSVALLHLVVFLLDHELPTDFDNSLIDSEAILLAAMESPAFHGTVMPGEIPSLDGRVIDLTHIDDVRHASSAAVSDARNLSRDELRETARHMLVVELPAAATYLTELPDSLLLSHYPSLAVALSKIMIPSGSGARDTSASSSFWKVVSTWVAQFSNPLVGSVLRMARGCPSIRFISVVL